MSDVYDKAVIMKHMIDWFLSKHEDPVHNCPHDEGEYVYIWGGPVSAREALDDEFSDVFAEDLIAATVMEIDREHGDLEWSDVPVYEP